MSLLGEVGVQNRDNYDLNVFKHDLIKVLEWLCRLLESLEAVTASIPIPENSTEPVVITQPTFAVSVQEVEPELFSGFTFSASVGSGPGAELNSDSLTFGENSNNAKAPRTSMSLPANLFQSIHVTNTTRITQSVFINDALFLRRNITVGQLEVGAIILSAEVVGSEVAGLDPPITLTFLKNQVHLPRNCKWIRYINCVCNLSTLSIRIWMGGIPLADSGMHSWMVSSFGWW